MGTRSLTWVHTDSEDKLPLVCMYRQYDGYMEGHGLELAEFLAPYHVVNGLGGDTKAKVANGMGCLAAQMIAHFKVGAGQFYMQVPEPGIDCAQEYEYHVYNNKVIVYAYDKLVFDGTWAEFWRVCKDKEAEYNKKFAS